MFVSHKAFRKVSEILADMANRNREKILDLENRTVFLIRKIDTLNHRAEIAEKKSAIMGKLISNLCDQVSILNRMQVEFESADNGGVPVEGNIEYYDTRDAVETVNSTELLMTNDYLMDQLRQAKNSMNGFEGNNN